MVLEKKIFLNFVNVFSLFHNYHILPWKRAGPFIWTNLNPLHQRMLCAKFSWNWPSGSGEDFWIFSMYFRYFVIISPWKRAGPINWSTWIPFTQGCFVPSLVEIGSVVLEKKIFNISSMYFHYFVIISSWKRAWPFIWKNLNPLQARMLCSKFGWNWPSGSTEENQISSMYFHYFVIISPWKRAGPFIWTNMNPLYPRMLCAKFG